MRKIQLDVDALKVESFPTSEGEAEKRGTVHGHNSFRGTCQETCQSTCAGPTCDPPCENEPTAYMTCVDCRWETGDPCMAVFW